PLRRLLLLPLPAGRPRRPLLVAPLHPPYRVAAGSPRFRTWNLKRFPPTASTSPPRGRGRLSAMADSTTPSTPEAPPRSSPAASPSPAPASPATSPSPCSGKAP